VLRLSALLLIVWSINPGITLGAVIIRAIDRLEWVDNPDGMIGLLIMTLVFVVQVALAVVLLAKSNSCAAFIVRGLENPDTPASLDTRTLAAIGYSVAGLVFLVIGISGIVEGVTEWHYTERLGPFGAYPEISFDRPRLFAAIAETLLGAWFMFYPGKVPLFLGSIPRTKKELTASMKGKGEA
jgi:hypothetical protein